MSTIMNNIKNNDNDQKSNLSARDIYEMKEQAKQYYGQNKVPEKMEDVLNSMFFDNPNDIYGYLVRII